MIAVLEGLLTGTRKLVLIPQTQDLSRKQILRLSFFGCIQIPLLFLVVINFVLNFYHETMSPLQCRH